MTPNQLIHYYIIVSTITVDIIALSVIFGYIFNNAPYFQLSTTPMALDTAVSLTILSTALMVRSIRSYGSK